MISSLLSPARSLRNLLTAAVVLAGSWSSANAAVYTGVWDPPYGSPFSTLTTGLGWSGTAEFFVPDSCVPSGDALVINPLPVFFGGCGGAAAVTSAQVTLYDIQNPGNNATLTFAPSSFYVGLLAYDNGELEGLLTDFSNLVTTGFTNFGITPTTEFSLIFTLDGPRLAWRDCGYSEGYRSSNSTHSTHHECTGGINSDAEGYRPDFTISRVPEPGTLALASLALLLLAPRRARALLLRR
jgi:hypothetical protein